MELPALFAFILAATIGLFMATLHFRGTQSPTWVGALHGLFVATGLIFLVVGLLRPTEGDPAWGWWVLAAFGATALGGSYLLSRGLRKQPWPSAVVVAHGGLALVSIGLLGVWLSQ